MRLTNPLTTCVSSSFCLLAFAWSQSKKLSVGGGDRVPVSVSQSAVSLSFRRSSVTSSQQLAPPWKLAASHDQSWELDGAWVLPSGNSAAKQSKQAKQVPPC